MTKTYRTPALLALAALFSTGAMAVGNSIEDTHSFRLGVASQDADIKAQSSIDPFPPIEIDLTDDLGMDDNSESIYLKYRWRFSEKWQLSVAYQQLELDGNGVAGFDFNFDGKPFTAGVAVDTEFNMDTYLIDIGYSLVRNDQWEVVVGLGIHAFDFDTSITTTLGLEAGGDGFETESVRAGADVLAPLPNLRGRATYLITPRWEISGGLGWLSLNIDDFDGSYYFAEIGTEYRITDRFGIGATYQVSTVDVTVDDGADVDKVDVDFSGPSIYLSYGF